MVLLFGPDRGLARGKASAVRQSSSIAREAGPRRASCLRPHPGSGAQARQIRRFFGGRQPLCGIGVTSWICMILMPSAFSARTDDSRPGPGPLISTSRFLMPHSCAARPAASAATWAANGVDLREPLKPAPPDDAHDRVLPWRSVMVMIVLLKDAWTCAMPSETFFFAFLRARDAAAAWTSDRCRAPAGRLVEAVG